MAIALVIYFYIWPNLSGNWVKKMDRSHPELVFSKYKIGDPISKLPRPLVPLNGSPLAPTKAKCDFYSEHVVEALEPCEHRASDGLVYENNGDAIEGIIVPLDRFRSLTPLPWGIMPSEKPTQLMERLKKSSFDVEVIFRYGSNQNPRVVGWQIDKRAAFDESPFGWIEFDENQKMTAIGAGYINFD
ncbi:MAG: hypothetical protein FD163_1707 [Hyphomonadaceae bacterium]|nr:MAG: hypothetical protein FD128_824 [Hyphomonadaceae bacterium]KAF0185010.1 MAG: hypothetical protein FD163_1707 [Hyphomonadaceae bacterium]